MKLRLSIIGYGRFGRLAASHLRKYCTVEVYDRKKITNKRSGIHVVSLDRAAQAEVILLAVPMNALRALLRNIAPVMNRNALVIDVSSVKEQPIKWMTDHLPPTVSILGSHPLFGPSSASASVEGRSIILCPVRISKSTLLQIKNAVREGGLRPRWMTPADHDRLIAKTLFVTQYLGRVVQPVIAGGELPTMAYHYLQGLAAISAKDSPSLLGDMYRYNRFARASLSRLSKAWSHVEGPLISAKNPP